jgi:hypothetical protein
VAGHTVSLDSGLSGDGAFRYDRAFPKNIKSPVEYQSEQYDAVFQRLLPGRKFGVGMQRRLE